MIIYRKIFLASIAFIIIGLLLTGAIYFLTSKEKYIDIIVPLSEPNNKNISLPVDLDSNFYPDKLTKRITCSPETHNTLFEKFNKSEPGLLITMLTLPIDSNGMPNTDYINVETCTSLGSISKPIVNIMDLTLLNKKLPLNIYNSNSYYTNFGILLDPSKLMPKDFPNKYVQCLRVRDSGSDLRRCDTDFSHKLKHDKHHHHKTYGKYNGFDLRSISQKCSCHYEESISNVCNSKAEVVGCGAKCEDTGKICGQVDWCDWDDFDNYKKKGLDCATHPRDIQTWIDATVEWNKKRIEEGWNIPHHENELDAYIENNEDNQEMIMDAILGFVFTDMCGENNCSTEITDLIQKQMEIATNDFNKFYSKNVKLYKLMIDTNINVGAYKNGKFVKWEDNNYKTDLESLLVDIKLDPNNVTQPKQTFTYRVAETIDGINGKNTGTIKGDNSYISGEFCPRHGDEYCKNSIISEYSVDYLPINPKIVAREKDGRSCKYGETGCKITQDGFGPYALCNPGGEVGGTGAYECTDCMDNEIPDYEKTCANHPGVEHDRFSGGKWYSWPNKSYCKGKPLGTNGCTWNFTNTNHYKINDIDNYQLLLSDKYKVLEQNCKNSSDRNHCISKSISNFVQENAENNIQALNNAFQK
jgi:hypothetical protein|uniref:Uncharacterized protein n=1 Tax=viral metagenome TaxID=1070528 RepID=A0A6C0IZT5_9ZZZZ